MHNVLVLRYPVRVLKFLPLHPILNRSRYAYRDIRFCTDEWEANRITPFYHNVLKDAITLWVWMTKKDERWWLASKTHNGMLSQLGLHYIKTGIIEDRLGGFLTRMEQMREKGDYNCLFSISEEELMTIIDPAKELIEVIEDLIASWKHINSRNGKQKNKAPFRRLVLRHILSERD